MRRLIVVVGLALLLGLVVDLSPTSATNAVAEAALKPVDKSMHEFMEYYFQPTYRRLKSNMSIAEKSNTQWKGIKADAMILAEGGNLLLTRKAPKSGEEWQKQSLAIRKLGAELYRAAKKKNAAESNRVYRAMLVSCNQCHNTFAGGKHQLKP